MNSYRDLSLSLARALVRAQTSEAHGAAIGRPSTPPPFTVAISREAGAQGSVVAAEVGRRLGWPVYDSNILDKVAGQLRRPASQLAEIDERPTTWLGECLSAAFDPTYVGSVAYRQHLSAVVRALGEGGACVIVGRGSSFLLPEETTLRVRLVADPEDRAKSAARRLGFSADEAANWVEKTERERLTFVKRNFGKDATDPHHYDLLLNMSRLSAAEATDVIIETLRRFERRAGTARPAEEAREATPALA